MKDFGNSMASITFHFSDEIMREKVVIEAILLNVWYLEGLIFEMYIYYLTLYFTSHAVPQRARLENNSTMDGGNSERERACTHSAKSR